MKKHLLSLLGTALFMAGSLMAQTTNYTVLHDGAKDPTLNVNFEYFSLDMGVKNIDGTSFNFGTNGFFEPVAGLGAQWNIKRSFLALGRLGNKDFPSNVDISAGGYYMFSQRSAKKLTKVVLSREYTGEKFSTNVSGDRMVTRTEEVTFMQVPAERRFMTGLRGGYYMKRGGFVSDDLEGTTEMPLDEMSLTSIGIYAGITRRSLKNIFIETDSHGIQYNSIGDDFALDLLIVPVNVFRDLNADKENVTAEVKDQLGGLPFGFRIGWYRYQIEQKSWTGKKFGMSASFEAGLKPYQGPFINAGLGLTLIKQ